MSRDLSFTTLKDDVTRVSTETLENELSRRVYNASEVQQWTG